MLSAVPALAEPPRFSMTLAQAEIAARAHSLELRAAAEESVAAKDRADADFAALLPRLTIDGSYHYQTEVPALSILPNVPPRPFGDHRATAIGPTLNWTLWDEGSLYKTWKARKASAKSQEEIEKLTAAQAVLGARLAYVQVQLAREQVRLLAESVSLAAAQYRDIGNRLRAGAASRIDTLSSHHEELERRKDFLSAQASLGASLRELFQLVGENSGLDISRPVDVRISNSLLRGLSSPTLLVALDDLEATPPDLAAAEKSHPDPNHPSILAYDSQAEAARLNAQGISAGGWPKIQFQALASYEYPNGPVLEYVTQKAVGLTASIPLFEGRQTARLADQQARLAKAAEHRRDLIAEQGARDWDKARVTLEALREQQLIDETAVAESEELARLVYISYKAGTSNFIEVQTYNLNALQAKVQAAQTRAQILIQLAIMAQLAVQG